MVLVLCVITVFFAFSLGLYWMRKGHHRGTDGARRERNYDRSPVIEVFPEPLISTNNTMIYFCIIIQPSIRRQRADDFNTITCKRPARRRSSACPGEMSFYNLFLVYFYAKHEAINPSFIVPFNCSGDGGEGEWVGPLKERSRASA